MSCSIEGRRLTHLLGQQLRRPGGHRSSDDALVPIGIPLVAVRAAALGDRHSCALVSAGGLYCWGANDRGQLGLPASAAVLSPTPSLAAATICQ